MVGWHHQLNGHEFEPTPGEVEGQGSLECCSSWGHKELDTTEQLDNKNNNNKFDPAVPLLKCVCTLSVVSDSATP